MSEVNAQATVMFLAWAVLTTISVVIVIRSVYFYRNNVDPIRTFTPAPKNAREMDWVQAAKERGESEKEILGNG